jgi:ADP-dependent NAD(P)H-hydrate dehydratase / NAD(P)H-hydrate epimerase
MSYLKNKMPLVVDADALNILAENKSWLEKLPQNSILTPHPGEFKRLAGDAENSYLRIQKQIEFSKNYNVIVVLKGAFTSISTPDGRLFFNSTGNPEWQPQAAEMCLPALFSDCLHREYSPENAAVAGVYLHGLAGDLAAARKSEFSLVAGDITEFLSDAFNSLNSGSK